MLNRVIAFALQNRLVVLALALILSLYGAVVAARSPIDVLPDLNRPTVTIMTEAPGLAPEEVETLVTFPIESMLNGATDVLRVRSASGIGLSIVWVEFDWGTDIFRDRQIVAERLVLARERLPEGVEPVMTPISSIMGEIMLVGLTSKSGATPPMEVRTLAEWAVRPQLLSVSGISQVSVMGGGLKQFQVVTTPERLKQLGVTIDDLSRAVAAANVSAGGGFVVDDRQESLIRIVGRTNALEEIGRAVVRATEPAPVLVRHVADLRFGTAVQRGDGSVDGGPAVILAIQKQPGADTLVLTEGIDAVLADVARRYPDLQVHDHVFRQEEFIHAAIANVLQALRDGGVLVVVVLFLFLLNVRMSLIILTAIPLSLLSAVLVFDWFGLSINTMTLGGLAVAVGELVDDAIVDLENIYRRLRENRTHARPEPALVVIFKASSEVRSSIVFATLITGLVVVPLLNLGGVEGRMFAPIAVAYIVSLFASLVVSVTVTPVLASFFLPRARIVERSQDAFLLRLLKRGDEKLVRAALRHPRLVLGGAGAMVGVAVFAYLHCGGEFLPPFNEGTFTVNTIASPGTSLTESNRIGTLAEQLMHEVPEVVSTSRRTGRAELDEHAANVNYSEIDVRLRESGRPRDAVMNDIRERLAYLPGVLVNVGQPISHRIDHLLSGIRAQIAVKIFGPDLPTLRNAAQILRDRMSEVEGVVDLQVEEQVDIPQLQIRLRADEIQRYGLTKEEVTRSLETALKGRTVSEVLDGQRVFDLVVWFDEDSRSDPAVISRTLIEVPSGGRLPLSTFADVSQTAGPNTINRENVTRRIVVQCNVAGRDLAGVVADIQALEPGLGLPGGYFVAYGGQFEAQQEAARRIYALSVLAVLAIFVLLVKALGSWRAAVQCLVNLPLAFVGGVIAVYLFGDRTLSVASLIGFLTLTGIVMRNGIMMISHYIHLMRFEGERFDEHMIVRGTLERLAPVLMTAVTAGLGLVPLALGKGETGKELLHPLAIVIIGGLISSTLLDQVVTPALFFTFGRGAYEQTAHDEEHLVVPPDLRRLADQLDPEPESSLARAREDATGDDGARDGTPDARAQGLTTEEDP